MGKRKSPEVKYIFHIPNDDVDDFLVELLGEIFYNKLMIKMSESPTKK
jgi:hypothetical protein